MRITKGLIRPLMILDMSYRRDDIRGFWPDKRDYIPIDELGGWRENWGVRFIGREKR